MSDQTNNQMDEQDMSEVIMDALYHDNEECGTETQVTKIYTFEELGILTTNTGLVVRMKDGSEFQITIVKSN